MVREDKRVRSLKKHEVSKIRFSQIIIVVLLIFGIVTAVLIALPQGWRDSITKNIDEKSEVGRLVKEAADTGKLFQGELSEVITKIENLQAVDEGVVEAIEVIIPEPPSDELVHTTKYINFDWNISFSLPPSWSYEAKRGLFISGEEHLKITRIPEFILPASWELLAPLGSSTEALARANYYKETDEKVHHATVIDDIYTYIFTASTTDRFTKEQETIITSLSVL